MFFGKEIAMHVYIVGCGGTGSALIKEFARYLSSKHYSYMNVVDVTLIDGDIVEKKNLDRQAFIESDINHNKAEAMALAVQEVFGLNFYHYTHYLTRYEQLEDLLREEEGSIIIGCVDNHQCRQVLHQVFEKRESVVYIDAANEYQTGEVVVAIKVNGNVFAPDRAAYFPEILKKQRSVEELSCQELNQSTPQHVVTNILSANICLAQLLNVLDGDFTHGGIYYFDAFKSDIHKGEMPNAR